MDKTKIQQDLELVLIDLKSKVDKIQFILNNPIDVIYDYCSELRHEIQLDTEETIAKIKVDNGYGVNRETNELSEQVQKLIQNLIERLDFNMNKIDALEQDRKNSISKLKLPERFAKEIDDFYKDIKEWSNDLKIVGVITRPCQVKMFKHKLKCMNEEIEEFVPNLRICVLQYSDFEYIKFGNDYDTTGFLKNLIKTTDLKKLPASNGKVVEGFFNIRSIFDGSICLIVEYSNMFTYDLNTSTILNQKFLDGLDFHRMRIVNDLIVLECVESGFYRVCYRTRPRNVLKTIIVLDKQLNVKYKIVEKDVELLGADESFIYFRDSFKFKNLVIYDWRLIKAEKEFKKDIKSIVEDEKEEILFFKTLDDKILIMHYNHNEKNYKMELYDKNGSLVRKITNFDITNFSLESNKNLVFEYKNRLKIFDLNGILVKIVDFPKDFKFKYFESKNIQFISYSVDNQPLLYIAEHGVFEIK